MVDSHLKFDRVQKLAGFLGEDISTAATEIQLVRRGFFHSDQKEFYSYVDKISNTYLRNYFVDSTNTFLIIIHRDWSADVYVNEVPITVSILGKRDIQEGESVGVKDIADIVDLRFRGIDIKQDDNIMFCFRKGWKFGLFFDFTQYNDSSVLGVNHGLDVEALYQELAGYHKYLTFQEVYAALENVDAFEQMISDGWFPFLQLLPEDFHELSSLYKDRDFFASSIDGFADRFDKDRVESFVNHWWRNQVFEEKQQIIESGITAYLADDLIGCINTLYLQIEGILRIGYFRENNRNPKKSSELVKYLERKAKSKFISRNSLGFPDVFIKYLVEIVFKGFNLQEDEVDLSRHSVAHGVAKVEAYTRTRALQAILILDQMYSFLT